MTFMYKYDVRCVRIVYTYGPTTHAKWHAATPHCSGHAYVPAAWSYWSNFNVLMM